MENEAHIDARQLLREWFKAEGRKKSWLADQLQVDRKAISRWLKEGGKTVPYHVHRERLAMITGLPISQRDVW